jgi:hypothetical protein
VQSSLAGGARRAAAGNYVGYEYTIR